MGARSNMERDETTHTRIRKFVRCQLRDCVDLSTLTLGILKRRYLAVAGCDSITAEAKNVMKKAVEQELLKMQDNDTEGSELETRQSQNKRKRGKENEERMEGGVDDEDESRAKKPRRLSSSSDDCGAGSEESEEEAQSETGDAGKRVRTSQTKKTNETREEDSDEEDMESTKNGKEEEGRSGDSSSEVEQKAKTTESGEKEREKNTSTAQRKEGETDGESESSETHDGSESSDDDGKQGNVSEEKKADEPAQDSDSSSQDEQDSATEKTQITGKRTTKKVKSEKEESTKKPTKQKSGDKAVSRLKRFICLCGARRNYKKLLEDCNSVRSKVAVLKKELEDLGVKGNPTIKKCKKVREQREEAQDVAHLDVGNIITTQGRPKRRGASAQWDPPSSTYQRALNSSSDGEDEHTARGSRRVKDWANLQGIISDDGDSD